MLWRRLDTPGHEAARISSDGPSWLLTGTAVFSNHGAPCRLGYRVHCDSEWRTLAAEVDGWIGDASIQVEVVVDAAGDWRINGAARPEVSGCTDLDLNFSPSTNLLPIRRLKLAIGEEASVRAAWLRFPSFELEPLDQVYRRTKTSEYRYESAGGAFVRDLQVNQAGFVTDYAGFWTVET